jgi:hypothetical protein
VADAIINNDSGDEDEICNGAENVKNILDCFQLFFDKEIIEHIVTETNRYAEQYINGRGNLFSFRSPVRKWTPVTFNEI